MKQFVAEQSSAITRVKEMKKQYHWIQDKEAYFLLLLFLWVDCLGWMGVCTISQHLI